MIMKAFTILWDHYFKSIQQEGIYNFVHKFELFTNREQRKNVNKWKKKLFTMV